MLTSAPCPCPSLSFIFVLPVFSLYLLSSPPCNCYTFLTPLNLFYSIYSVSLLLVSLFYFVLSFFFPSFSLSLLRSLSPPLLFSASPSQSPALAQLVALYVGRSHTLWKEAGVLLWLEGNVGEVLRRVDTQDPHVEDCLNKWVTVNTHTHTNIQNNSSHFFMKMSKFSEILYDCVEIKTG